MSAVHSPPLILNSQPVFSAEGLGHTPRDQQPRLVQGAGPSAPDEYAVEGAVLSPESCDWSSGLDAAPGHPLAITSQAAGMVMVQLGSTIEEAMARLCAHASAADVSLEDVSRSVVERTFRFNPDLFLADPQAERSQPWLGVAQHKQMAERECQHMASVELAQRIPRQRESQPTGLKGELALELPASLDFWVAALALWSYVDEPRFHLVARCYATGEGAEWTCVSSLLQHSDLVEPGPAPGTFTFRSEWQPSLDRALLTLGGANAVRSRLVNAWLVEPDRRVAGEVARWASDLARWDALDEIWMALAEQTGPPPNQALAVFRDLPLEARRARPMLTWASGAAESLLANSPRQEGEATLQRLLLDSALVHADWSVREDTDAAVGAGTLRMIGERRLPTSHAGQSLAAAWHTKQDIDAFIDARSRTGTGPGRRPQAIFQAFSARLALLLDDPRRAVSEARWAGLLSDWPSVTTLAAGVEALGQSISSDERPARRSTPRLTAIDPTLGVRGLKGIGQVLEILADGNEGLRTLSRDEVDRSLALITPETAAIAGVWSVRAALAGFRAALWGDVGFGLDRLSTQIFHQAILGREHEEPLGGSLLTKTRVLLLTKAGAFGAATQAAGTLSGSSRLLPLAHIHVWAGQFERAIRLADAARNEPGLTHIDQERLTTLKAAAALLDDTCCAELRDAAMTEMRRMVHAEAFLPIAMLPKPAREALVQLYQADDGAGSSGIQPMLERLQTLNDAGEHGIRPVHLTDREAILLPMLATDDRVPEIARKANVSVNTVRKQVVTLRKKFQADTRAEMITKAISYGAIH